MKARVESKTLKSLKAFRALPQATKKNIKVKKNNGKGDISITIENNLNANNKQINHQSKYEQLNLKVITTLALRL